MLMMNVKKELINSKVRSMLGKCRIAICYAEEITALLYRLNSLVSMRKRVREPRAEIRAQFTFALNRVKLYIRSMVMLSLIHI